MTNDFRAALIAHAQASVERAGRAQTEAAAQQYLVLPFIQLLGYDPLNPDEVIPESHASFSEKFKNRVDFAICRDGHPVIAIECKKVGGLVEANRGELKGYFNALPSVKLGILTDGLVYQLFTDTRLENMMDDEPFTTIDLAEIAREQVPDGVLDALLKLRKGSFDPADVGDDARRRRHLTAYVRTLDRAFEAPDERFVRLLMDLAEIDGRRTGRLLEEHGPIIRDALRAFMDKQILARVGFAERSDLVRVPEPIPSAPPETVTPAPAADAPEGGVVTTETELFVLGYVRTRLPFLIERDEALFQRLAHLHPMDYKTVFAVYYKAERKGKLFNFREGTTAPRYRFEFVAPAPGVTVETDDLTAIDGPLLEAFKARVAELG